MTSKGKAIEFIALSVDDNSIHRITESLASTRIGNVPSTGDLWEIAHASHDEVYIVDHCKCYE